MSNEPTVITFENTQLLAQRIRDDLNNLNFVMLFAYNGTGKTRLSMAFKDAGKKKIVKSLVVGDTIGQRLTREEVRSDTLYFNAFTEDLFTWDNDLDGDAERILRINSNSRFFSGFKELALEEKIFSYLERYSDFDFKIDYEKWIINFFRDKDSFIKVSRGEEKIFIWCIYMAICELTIDSSPAYSWVKYFYIDDPISSLDDNNTIAVAADLARLLKKGQGKYKAVISTHHGLFFNVVCNELKKHKHNKYFLHKDKTQESYTLRKTNDTPFFHHVTMLSELQAAIQSNKLYTHHFNMLRSILEKTATFFGFDDFSACIHGVEDEVLYARALNLLSHGKYSAFEPREMVEDTKNLFRRILQAFLDRYKFHLPELISNEPTEANQA